MSDISQLHFIDPSTGPQPLNVLLYGPPGQGKSVAACSAPGPVLVVNADRHGSLRFARRVHGDAKIREVRFEGRKTIRQVQDYLRKSADVQTVVVDPLGEVYETLRKEIGGRTPSQQQWMTIVSEAREFYEFLRDSPHHVVLVAHEAVEDSDDGGPTRRPMTGGTKLPEQTAGMMDVMAYCAAVEQEDGSTAYLGQLVQAKGRRAKDGTGVLGKVRKLDLAEWISHVHEAYRPDDSDLPWDGEGEQPAAMDTPADTESPDSADASASTGPAPADAGTGRAAKAAVKTITDAQQKRLWTIARKAQVTNETMHALTAWIAGVESTKEIPKDRYDDLVNAVDNAESALAVIVAQAAAGDERAQRIVDEHLTAKAA